MGKPRQTLWKLDEHSEGKHLVLKSYLDAWFPILSKYNKRLLFIDGFSGPGEYLNGHKGSPLIALEAALLHTHKDVRNQEIIFYFVEDDESRLQHLKDLVAEKYPVLPTKFSIYYANSKFDEAIDELLTLIEEQNSRLAPCFAMVDPFGVSDTPMSILNRLLKNSKSEIYISVMYENINRFLRSKEFEPHLDRLFGSDEWRKAQELNDRKKRKEYLYDLYKKKLKESGASNAIHFDLNKGDRHVYSIFFATGSWMGTDKMKQAIWKIAPEGDFVYRGGAGNELDLSVPNFQPLIQAISDEFSGQWVTTKVIESFVGSDKTIFHSSQYKKNALRPLEERGQLVIHPDDVSKRARRFTYKDNIRFKIS